MEKSLILPYKYTVYYGSYSLKYWIELVLTNKIQLPPYQRSFVWKPNKVISLLESIEKGLFIPPIVLGNYFDEAGVKFNYIIDGHQRLTSLVLLYFGIYPINEYSIKKTNDDETETIIDFNINILVEEIKKLISNRYANFKSIFNSDKFESLSLVFSNTKKFVNINDKIINVFPADCINLQNISYYNNQINSIPSLFDNCYIGFSYIKPTTQINSECNYKEQQNYFASVFKNINDNSTSLNSLERRKALYWVSGNIELFSPSLLSDYKRGNDRIDFARFLSFLSEYYKLYLADNRPRSIPKYDVGKYCRTNEHYDQYIINFINSFISKSEEKFYVNIRDKSLELKNAMTKFRFPNVFKNYAELDLYFFGVIYWIYFENKSFDDIIDITKFIQDFKLLKQKHEDDGDGEYNRIGKIRERIKDSISLYYNYVKRGLF